MEMSDQIVRMKTEEGNAEVALVESSAEEIKSACADLSFQWKRFIGIDRRDGAASDPKREVEWWRAVEALGLADSRLKQAFTGGRLDPASIKAYCRFRRKLLFREEYGADA